MPNLLKFKRGLAGTIPTASVAEPLFTTDTYDLYIGNGSGGNQRFQKYIASGTTSQYLRGDGSLATHDLDSLTDVVISSPSNGQILKYNGSNWINAASGFLTGSGTAAGQIGVFSSLSNIAGYTTFTYDTVNDKLNITNGYVNNNLTVDGQLVIKSENGASAYTRGLKFPDNSYGGTGDTAGLRLYNSGGDNLVLELYVGNDSLDNINFAVAAGGSTYNDNVTINGNKIWNAGNLPSPLSSTGTINSGEIAIFSNSTTAYSDTKLFWDNSLDRLGVGGNAPSAQVGVTTSSGVNAIGYRTSGAGYYEMNMVFDSTSYGYSFQTGRVGGLTTAKPISFLNNTTILSIDESNNIGVNTLSPVVSATSNTSVGIDVYSGSNTVSAGIALHTISSGTTSGDGFRVLMRNDGSVFMINQETGGMTINAGTGNYEIITNAATSFKIDSTTNKIGINNPVSIAEVLTVNGSIQQSGTTSAVIKANASGKLIAAVAGTDYVAPSALSGYVPTSRTITINGTAYDLSADRSWSVGTVTGSGTSGRVTYWDASGVTSAAGFIYDNSTKRLGVNTTVPNATIGATASSGYGFLTKNADSNYNGIGIGYDATYGNLLQTEKLGTASAANLTLLNQSGYISVTEGGNVGINILSANPSTSGPGGIGLDIYSSTTAAIGFKNSTSGTASTDGGRIYYNSTNMTIRNLETGSISVTADAGNFQVITYGAENIKVEGSTGKVGIGAPASIAEMLTVNGSIQQSGVTSAMLKANASGKIIAAVAGTDYQAAGNYITGAGNSGYLPKYTGSYTIANSLVYDNATNVLVNTTSDNTYEKLQVAGGIYGTSLRINTSYYNSGLTANIRGQIYVDNRTATGNRIFLTPNTTSTTPYMHFYEPFTAFNTNGGFALGTSSSLTDTPTNAIMHWDGNNIRVGINKTNPSTTLDVAGAATFTGALTGTSATFSGNVGVGGTGSDRFYVAVASNGNNSRFDGPTSGLIIQTNASSVDVISYGGVTPSYRTLNFATSASTALSISTTGAATFSSSVTAGGNIQTNGSANLYIKSTGFISNQLGQLSDFGASDAGFYVLSTGGLQFVGGGANRMTLTSGGNVGIGTSSPAYLLDVQSGADFNTRIKSTALGGTIGILFETNNNFSGTSQAWIKAIGSGSSGLSDLTFGTAGTSGATTATERMRITSGGNVGIGTNSPGALLDVNGVAYFRNANGIYSDAITAYSGGDLLLGYGASGNLIIKGGSGFTERMRITSNGNIGMPTTYGFTTSNAANLYIDSGAGYLYRSTSSKKYKTDIKNYDKGLNEVMQMKPVYYQGIGESDKNKQFAGLIAEDIDELGLTEFVQYAQDGSPDALAYQNMVALLTKAIQELKAELDTSKAEIEILKSK